MKVKKMEIPFSKPYINQQEIKAVNKVLLNGWLTTGHTTKTFEEKFAQYVNAKNAIAVNSCTSALFLALKALKISQGDKVILPSFTFASTANVIVHCGAIPVFVDIQPKDFTLDSKLVIKKIDKKVKAIIPVHYAGNKANISYPIPIIEDSAHRIAKNYNSPNIVCYSFYATKNLTTGEGGMITTNNQELALWLSKAKGHGLSKDAWKRYEKNNKWQYEVEFPGYKFNLTDICSAIGLVQLKKFDSIEKKRKKLVEYYNKLLGLNNQGTHLYPILVNERNKFIEYMKKQGIQCSVHFIPLHKTQALSIYSTSALPITDFVSARVVTLPLFTGLTTKEINYIAEKIFKFGKFTQSNYGLKLLS